ncbi:MAG: (2Fe-2S)-binding protein [Clostridiales bacterium]|nr:(2Fe-2S)-binding protein [Clostridiales bacterium]MCF8023828.1 (2Fe-2S)-binding protein [Clostridiales bacterium]
MSEKKPVYICRCQEITEDDIKKAIEDGARTVKGVKNRTGATMGLCQGRTCRKLIERMLARYVDMNEIKPGTRPPVRTVKIDDMVKGEEVENE